LQSRSGIVDESYEQITRKSQQSSDSAQSDWDQLRWLSVLSRRRDSLAIPCGSLWIYIFGWSLAGMGAQTEIEKLCRWIKPVSSELVV
jgi:hypothetical protein